MFVHGFPDLAEKDKVQQCKACLLRGELKDLLTTDELLDKAVKEAIAVANAVYNKIGTPPAWYVTSVTNAKEASDARAQEAEASNDNGANENDNEAADRGNDQDDANMEGGN